MSKHISIVGIVEMPYQRVNYFAGQFLEDLDFQSEQKYHLMRRRQLNKELFRPGVRGGFQVELKTDSENAVVVGSGAAIDNLGRELWLEADTRLALSPQADGDYFLYMQATEKLESEQTYVVPASDDKEKGKDSTWVGHTRSADRIEFCIASEACGPDYIRLARLKYVNDKLASVDNGDRDISVTSLGGGLTVNASGHYLDMYQDGKLQAYIGAGKAPLKPGESPGDITFSSMSKRMFLAGDRGLYIQNTGPVVISREWDAEKGGTLFVQGKTTLQDGLTVIRNVVVKKDSEEKGGDLTVHGETHLQNGLNVTNDADITGVLTVVGELSAGSLVVTDGGLANLKGALHVAKDVDFKQSLKVVGELSAGSLVVTDGGLADLKGALHVAKDVDFKQSLKVGAEFNPGPAGGRAADDLYALDVNGAARFQRHVIHSPGSFPAGVEGQPPGWAPNYLHGKNEFIFAVSDKGTFMVCWTDGNNKTKHCEFK